MKSNLVFYRRNENEESWLIAPKKKKVLFHSLWVIFSVETVLYNDTTCGMSNGKRPRDASWYISRHTSINSMKIREGL